jgi:hypothetical protein
LGDPAIIYNYSAGSYGNIRNTMNNLFSDFIIENRDINNIVEIGAGHGILSDIILDKIKVSYTIIDPTFSGIKENKTIIKSLFEDAGSINGDTLIMSHIFEHFQKPLDVLETIYKSPIKTVYVNHPDMEYWIKNNYYCILNPEHTFYIENDFIEQIFSKYGFKLARKYHHENFSIFFEFKRTNTIIDTSIPMNKESRIDVYNFFRNIYERVKTINNTIKDLPSETKVYIWPCSMATTYLCAFGLDMPRIHGVIDNSDKKIGKYLYGYNLYCYSFEETIGTNDNIAVILNGGVYNKEVSINRANVKLI